MKSLCCVAFDTLCNKLKPDFPPVSVAQFAKELHEDLSLVPQHAPLFVTWDKNGHLRGCIGTFQPQETAKGVQKFALTAALHDTRFPPIKLSELTSLDVSVTLLANFTPIAKWDDWDVGAHGLKLNFTLDGGYYSGTFLPSVAPEQGWDKLTTVWYLLRKADYGHISKSSTADFYQEGLREGWLQLERYDGLKHDMSYDEYESVRQRIKF